MRGVDTADGSKPLALTLGECGIAISRQTSPAGTSPGRHQRDEPIVSLRFQSRRGSRRFRARPIPSDANTIWTGASVYSRLDSARGEKGLEPLRRLWRVVGRNLNAVERT